MQEGNEEPFNIRLHLAKDILTIQEQDVICVSGEPFYSSVSKTVLYSLNAGVPHFTLVQWCQLHVLFMNTWRLQHKDTEKHYEYLC